MRDLTPHTSRAALYDEFNEHRNNKSLSFFFNSYLDFSSLDLEKNNASNSNNNNSEEKYPKKGRKTDFHSCVSVYIVDVRDDGERCRITLTLSVIPSLF